jgi:hypothetical protein
MGLAMNKELTSVEINPNDITISTGQLTNLASEFYFVDKIPRKDNNGETEVYFLFDSQSYATEFIAATKCFRKAS